MNPAILLSPWLWLAVVSAAAAFLGNAWLDEKTAFAEYRGQVEALGQEAERRTQDRIALDKARKEASDASYQVALASASTYIDRLHKQAGRSGVVLPPAPANTRCPETQRCFDRVEFDAALQRFADRETEIVAATVGLVVEGAKVKLRLDNAIRWANPQPN